MKRYIRPQFVVRDIDMQPLMQDTSQSDEFDIEDEGGEPGESNRRRPWGNLWSEE